MIATVGVAVPAHNEVERIEACLTSVLDALAVAPPGVTTGVWVIADRCTDGTQAKVSRLMAGRPGCGWQDSRRHLPIGQLRHLGFLSALRHLGGESTDRTWLISTDADTTVPSSWIVDHLCRADAGAAAVAGSARLDSFAGLHPVAAARYHQIVCSQHRGGGHDSAYAANLGVRADAYLSVGGFRPLVTGEDADLLSRLEEAGYEVARPLGIQVSTSARLDGRARGGVSQLLRNLNDDAVRAGMDGEALSRPHATDPSRSESPTARTLSVSLPLT